MPEQYEGEYDNLINACESGNKASIENRRKVLQEMREWKAIAEDLKSDNARLREALVSLKDAYCDNCMWMPADCGGCKTIRHAQSALEGKP